MALAPQHTFVTVSTVVLTCVAILSPRDLAHKSQGPAGAVQREERALILALFVAMLLLRVMYIFHYPIDSDETQHLHVVWGWTHGLLQYRDVFDNHAPLFHILCAPLFAALGERPAVVFLMRLAMLPIYGLTLWSVSTIARVLFSPRVAVWAAVLTGLFLNLIPPSVGFRPDNLWAALWLLALAVLVTGRLTWERSFLVGLILGTALGVSLKTVLLLAALGLAGVGAVMLTALHRRQPSLRQLGICGATGLVGLLLVPLAVILFFVAQGAWTPFLYATVVHNSLPGLGRWAHPAKTLRFLVTSPFVWWGAHTLARRAPSLEIGIRRALIFLAAQIHILLLFSVWPLVMHQDYLPFYPFAIVLLTPAVLALPQWMPDRPQSSPTKRLLSRVLTPLFIAVLEIATLLGEDPPWPGGGSEETAVLADVLRLTQPGDLVMDLKGEMVFRPRAFYYALETVTRERIRRGLIADDIPERLVATGTCVAVADDSRFPPRARTFLQEHYLPVGHLRVVGRFLVTQAAQEGAQSVPFEVQIPARYALVAETGTVAGWLDGTPYTEARFLAPGHHEYRPSSAGTGRLALVWAQAVERGFSPFPSQSASP